MEWQLEIPDYEELDGIHHLMFAWDDGFVISVNRTSSEVAICANTAGLMSLARHCLHRSQFRRGATST